MKKKYALLLLFLLILFSITKSNATIHIITVQNYNFNPSSLTVSLGDTVKWQRVNGSHTTTSLTIPAGAAAWNSNLTSTTTTFMYKPVVLGTYNYKCTPHFSMNMTGSFTVVCPQVSPSITAQGTTSFCQGSGVVLQLTNPCSGCTYQWKKDGIATPETNTIFTVTSPGSYTIVVTNSCGNSGTSNAIVVTVIQPPTANNASISASGATTFCQGGSVTLTVMSSGFNYQWKKNGTILNGQINQTYNATKTGDYTCEVGNSCGTITSNLIHVTANNKPPAVITPAGPISMCQGDMTTLSANTGNNLAYQWFKNNVMISGATNSILIVNTAGNYKVKVTKTTTGCQKTSGSVTVTIDCKVVNEEQLPSVFPNPSTSEFTIRLNSYSGLIDKIGIYDLTGKLIESVSSDGEQVKFGKELSPGIYFIKFTSDQSVMYIMKILKAE